MTRIRWILAGAAVAAVGGCGNFVTTEIVGVAGLTADANGRPVVIVAPCGASYDRVQVVEWLDRRTVDPSADNAILLQLATPTMRTQQFTVSLTEPDSNWQKTGSFDPAAHAGYYIGVDSSAKDMGTTSVQVTRAAYEQVTADEVIVRAGEKWPRATFDRIACDPKSWRSAPTS